MAAKTTFRRVMRLFGISAKMDLAWLLRDTKYALAGITADMIGNLSVVSGVFLISVRFGGIGGMSADEVLFMMAYSTITTGLFIMFGAANNIHISRIIGRGQLEHFFIQPLSLKTQLFTYGFAPFTGGGNLVMGVILMIIAAHRLDLSLSVGWFLALAGYLLTTMAVIVARAYLASTLAFYSPVAAEEITSTVIEGTWLLSTFPLSGMPAALQIPLLTLLPEGLMAWFPSLCLLGRPPLGWSAAYPMLFALILALITSYFFRKGLNYYVRKGSNRYVPYGFRR
jgi:ABC-2 type transport system permease protein